MSRTGTQGLKKNLPKRCMSAGLKDRRKRSWERGQKRKEARRLAQEAQHNANLSRRSRGLPTPWQVAQATRVRSAAPRATASPVGAYTYASATDEPGAETSAERRSREHYWTTLRRKIEAL